MYSHFLNFLLLSLLPQHVPIETKNQYFSKYVCSYGIGQTIHGTIDYYLRRETRIKSRNFISDDPTEPDLTLQPPSFLVSVEYNVKDPNILAGGCYNGQVKNIVFSSPPSLMLLCS